jgi:cytochrome c5
MSTRFAIFTRARSTRVAVAAAIALAPCLAAAQAPERTGEQVVKSQCATCHEKGLHGAPRIDDRAAWTPRMKRGLDATVRSAIKGHGAMPARGGLADLTDAELRSAIIYLFNPAGIPPKPASAPVPGPNERMVNGTSVFLGVTPKSNDLYHVNITLRDSKTRATIDNAQVEVKVANPVMGDETKKLARSGAGNVVSYGNDFRIIGREPHTITVQIRRPEHSRVIETKFEFRN